MKLLYYATLRDITKVKEEIWDQPTFTVVALIQALCKKYGKEFKKWVSAEDGGHGSLSIILINGQDYRSLNGYQTELKQDDTISIFPPLAGG